MVHKIKMVMRSPNFDPSQWPSDALKQADNELGAGHFPNHWPDDETEVS
jgi:hypothetical protein